MGISRPTLSFAALEAAITRHYGPDPMVHYCVATDERSQTNNRMAMLCGVERRTIARMRSQGRVPFWSADRMAQCAGLWPGSIWPEMYADLDVDEMAVA